MSDEIGRISVTDFFEEFGAFTESLDLSALTPDAHKKALQIAAGLKSPSQDVRDKAIADQIDLMETNGAYAQAVSDAAQRQVGMAPAPKPPVIN